MIEAREVPKPKKGQSKSEYRPPFVSEDDGRERSVTETSSQRRSNPPPPRKDQKPSRYSSVTVEPPSSPRSPLLQVWEFFSPFLASPAPKHSLDQHRTQTRPEEEVLSASLKRHGAIKVRNTPSGRICIPNGRKDHQTFNRGSQQRPSAARNHKSQPTFGAKTNSPRLAQPIPIRPQTVSFKERLAFFESQLAPRGSSSTTSFHTARTHQPKSGSGGIPSDTSSAPSSLSSFFTARTHQTDSDTSPEGGASTVSSSLSNTKAQYSRSAYSERWDEFLAHGSLGLPSKYTGPGIRYRFCGCSSCVWAKTSEWKRLEG